MKLPSEKYFVSVQTKEEYYYFLSTGMLWELEPNAPQSWEEHQEMRQYKQNLELNKEEE